MIEASKRQREEATGGVFHLHRRLARKEALHRRLTTASWAAAVASAGAWLLGAPLFWHLGAVSAAFAAGAAWPVSDATERALEWIAGRTGLAYETALARGATADPYGFEAALEDRARASTTRVRPPTRQHWWIAVLAVAVGLLLLPAARLVGSPATTGTPQSPPDATAPVAPEPPEDEPVVEPETIEDFERAAEPDDAGGETGEQAAEGAGPGASGDQETLSRFLDNLRERDPFRTVDAPEEDATTPSPGPAPDDETGEQADGVRPDSARQPGEPQDGEEPGESAQGTGESSEGEAEGDQGQPEEGTEEGEGEGTPGPTEGEEEGEPREGDTPAGGDEPGDQEGELQPDAAPGTGAGPSAPNPSEGAEGSAAQEPEFLPGQLDQGPENPGGTVLLPGEGDIDVPPELRQGSYRRAAEEAVTDGQVPLEYQEIIRNYFR